MTTNSSFNNLTTYGNDIVNNPNYGLKSISGCGATVLTNNQFDIAFANVSVYPNPSSGQFFINSNDTITKISCVDVLGKQIDLQISDSNSFQINGNNKGLFVLKIELENNAVVYKKLVVN